MDNLSSFGRSWPFKVSLGYLAFFQRIYWSNCASLTFSLSDLVYFKKKQAISSFSCSLFMTQWMNQPQIVSFSLFECWFLLHTWEKRTFVFAPNVEVEPLSFVSGVISQEEDDPMLEYSNILDGSIAGRKLFCKSDWKKSDFLLEECFESLAFSLIYFNYYEWLVIKLLDDLMRSSWRDFLIDSLSLKRTTQSREITSWDLLGSPTFAHRCPWSFLPLLSFEIAFRISEGLDWQLLVVWVWICWKLCGV